MKNKISIMPVFCRLCASAIFQDIMLFHSLNLNLFFALYSEENENYVDIVERLIQSLIILVHSATFVGFFK